MERMTAERFALPSCQYFAAARGLHPSPAAF